MTPYLRVDLDAGRGEKRIIRDERLVVVDPVQGVEIDISPIVLKAAIPIKWGEIRTVELSVCAVVVET
jgi:hypothetical protein